MPHETSYHGWRIPDINADSGQWASILNSFFDGELETDVALRGAKTDRPATAPDNAVYHALDTGELFVYDTRSDSWSTALHAGGIVDGQAVQSGLDGSVVAVAPGLGVVDAIDPATTNTPVQDAVDAIDATGNGRLNQHSGGGVLLPPTTITRNGPAVTGLGSKTVRGWGASSVVNVNQNGDSFIQCSGRPENGMRVYLTDFVIDGGLSAGRGPDGRTNGSAIEATNSNLSAGRGFNIGRLLFTRWYGNDPVINFRAAQPYSCNWQWMRAEDYAGSFIHSSAGWFDMTLGNVFAYCRPGAEDHPVVDIPKLGGPSHIQSINVGGNVRRGLYVDKTDNGHTYLSVGHINLEPGQGSGGALNPSVANAPVEIYGHTGFRLGGLTIDEKLTSDYAVEIGGSIRHSGAGGGNGPGNNVIGMIEDRGSTVNTIFVRDAHDTPSWYWGAGSDIDYNGNSQNAVIPLADITTV